MADYHKTIDFRDVQKTPIIYTPVISSQPFLELIDC